MKGTRDYRIRYNVLNSIEREWHGAPKKMHLRIWPERSCSSTTQQRPASYHRSSSHCSGGQGPQLFLFSNKKIVA